MKTELLAPAGSFECFKQALYNGADAIYLATERFGARAYAKNLTLDELKKALILAHELNKKIYVTANTIIKENELEDAKNYLNTLYELGVDGVITTDFALVNHIINNLPEMECHISTQSGLKDLNDVRFFERLGAKRCVLARENTYEEIKYIKEDEIWMYCTKDYRSREIYEIRVEIESNIYRIFCCMDGGAVVVLFHGFQKKTQKTPLKEIKRAEAIKKEYFKSKEV